MIGLLLDVYSLLVLAAVVLSWVQVAPDNPLRRITDVAVEPVLNQIRRVLPAMGGLDLSPFVLLLGLRFLRRVIPF